MPGVVHFFGGPRRANQGWFGVAAVSRKHSKRRSPLESSFDEFLKDEGLIIDSSQVKLPSCESIAADHLRALVAAHASNDRAAMESACKELGAALEYLLHDAVESEIGYQWKYWCDSVLFGVNDVVIHPAADIALAGLALYGPKGSNWMAPLEAEFRLGEAPDSPITYRMRFGGKDADGEIVRTPFSEFAPLRDRLVRTRPRQDEDWRLCQRTMHE